ncbi:MAG: flagellar type III secretion system pore protein FliP [Hyphomicrobiales bacterium]|nr:flagellar type III secretion system pore protein FliP [Hyphomicrobiales bacterium]
MSTFAFAQGSGSGLNLDALVPPGDATATGRAIQLIIIITVLSVAPGLLMMVTCFTRFIIALSFLRTGLGLQTTPANLILISLALFMTSFVMAPTFDEAWKSGLKPYMDRQINEEEAYIRITQPFKTFMRANVREKDLVLFENIAREKLKLNDKPAPTPPTPEAKADDNPELRVLIPAFMVSELRRAFEIGFLIMLPFLVIDMIVATLVMSMGMMMLPPTVVSLPFKIMFFILIDGWNLLINGLTRSFN